MSIVSDAKELVDLIRKLDDAELLRKIVKLEEEVNELTYENRELHEKLRLQGEIHWDGRIYWLIKKEGSREGPYCQLCHDQDQRLTRLQSTVDKWYCLACKNTYPKIDSEITDEDRRTIEKERAEMSSFYKRDKWSNW
jgi:hypothetical protein